MTRPALRHLRADATRRAAEWWTPPRSRLRLRRRLFVFSAPVLLLLLVAAAAAVHVVRVGEATVDAFARQDVDALRGHIEQLRNYGVIDDAVVAYSEGDVLVLEGQLVEAEAQFATALTSIDSARSCPVRVNLELVRETLADIAVTSGRIGDAKGLYQNAITVVDEADGGCFQLNTDVNDERRALRVDAKARLERKLALVNAPPPPPPTYPSPVADQPPPPGGSEAGGPADIPPGLPPIAQRERGPGAGIAPQPPPLPGETLPSPPRLVPVPSIVPGPGLLPPEPPADTGVADPDAPIPIRIRGQVGPDGIPIGDPNVAGPPLTLGPDNRNPLERLEDLLESSNSYSGDRE
jgi:hypothetical protein